MQEGNKKIKVGTELVYDIGYYYRTADTSVALIQGVSCIYGGLMHLKSKRVSLQP